MLGIRHVALRVTDVEASVGFYTDVMKMRVEWRPDPLHAYLSSGTDSFALHQAESALAPAAAQSLDHFGFVVSTAGEVDAWAAEMEARGIELVQRPKTHRDGARSFYFRDPDGNLIQLIWIPYVGTRATDRLPHAPLDRSSSDPCCDSDTGYGMTSAADRQASPGHGILKGSNRTAQDTGS